MRLAPEGRIIVLPLFFITGILIFTNWSVWLYAVKTNQIIDASFGYFIMPILSVLFGFIFFQEKINKKRFLTILLVIMKQLACGQFRETGCRFLLM